MDPELAKVAVENLIEDLGFKAALSLTEKEGILVVAIDAGSDNPLLIGFHGETLLGLQTLINLILFRKTGQFTRVVLDVANYRQEREEKIKQLALNAADRARFLDRPVELTPMRADERRLVHLYVSQLPGVASESMGEGRERRVVVKPAGAQETPTPDSSDDHRLQTGE